MTGGYDYGRVWITPQTASQLLEKNVHNRSVDRRAVARLAAAIQAGEWRYNAQPIQLTEQGHVLDGQHRLLACVSAGIAIESLVVWDALPETQETMDMGKARTVSDVLKLRGRDNHHALAALGRRIALGQEHGLRAGATHPHQEVSPGAIVGVVEGIQNISRYVVEARQICKDLTFTAAQIGFLMWWFEGIDETDSEFFWWKLRTGEGLYEGDAIHTLRKLGMNRDVSGIGTHHHQYRTAGLIIKAWNKFRRGEQAHRLGFRVGGANPEPFPEAV
jgi:hypothetical protein